MFGKLETRIRRKRQLAGIRAARQAVAKGERTYFINGRPNRKPRKLTDETVRTIRDLVKQGKPKAQIARVLKISMPSTCS